MSEVEKLVSILKEMEIQFQGIEKRIDTIKLEMKTMKDVIKKVKKEFEIREIKLTWDMSRAEGEKPGEQK